MNKESLLENLHLRGISCTDQQAERLVDFMHTVLKANESFNLTAIKNESEFMEKMIFDSALGFANGLDLTGKKVIDVGTGAGFPGVVLYLLNPGMDLTLLDSTEKKINFLLAYGQSNDYFYRGVALRAEDYARRNRETFDYAYARAVAPLNVLLELIVPLLKVGGTFIAMKSLSTEEELMQSQKALKKLNCHLQKVYEDNLPECDERRTLIYIVKDKPTNKKYPREYSMIKNLPL